eukprot:TRINITY_DN11247_c0_g1_i17.p1 TRINITY_DN11247_c0_g1~~TRINITY_DN11247_c0_g1_i17.p1  ORF type:complete len:234 (+),score=37.80 TRINITY_DN11247_c0_g1_i17:25-702(+)
MIRRPPRSTPLYSSAASDVYKRQVLNNEEHRLPQIVLATILFCLIVYLAHLSRGNSCLLEPLPANSMLSHFDYGSPYAGRAIAESHPALVRGSTMIQFQCTVLVSVPLYTYMLFTLLSLKNSSSEVETSSFKCEHICRNTMLSHLCNVKEKKAIKRNKAKKKPEIKLDESLESASTHCETPYLNQEGESSPVKSPQKDFPLLVINFTESSSVTLQLTRRKASSAK